MEGIAAHGFETEETVRKGLDMENNLTVYETIGPYLNFRKSNFQTAT